MRFFSTFTGIGGFEIGIQNAYRATYGRGQENPQTDDETGHRLVATPGQGTGPTVGRLGAGSADGIDQRPLCIGYSEIDKYATKVFERHFGGVRNYGDITKIDAEKLPDFDCLVGGFPCQAFSIAGKRGGFEDTRGTLFFDLARILRAKQPRLFVFENVKGLLSHDNGRTFKTIIATIDELGYDCQWQVLNSKDFGVPQNRERIIIVGHLRGTTRPEVFPIQGDDRKAAFGAITNVYHKGQHTGSYVAPPKVEQINESRHQQDRIYDQNGISPTLSTMQGGNKQPKIIQRSADYRKDGSLREFDEFSQTLRAKMGDNHPMVTTVRVPEATKKGYAEAVPGQAINLTALGSKTRRGRVSDVANTLDTQQQQHTLTPDARIRRLTPLECERLQAFPDNWTQFGVADEPISNTQRYKMCGNAVTTNVIQAVFERIFESCPDIA